MPDPQAPSIELLISAMNRTEPPDVLSGVQRDERPSALVINQCTGMVPPPALSQPSLRMLSFAELGLSRSRNRGLDAADGDILLFGDDDLAYLPHVSSTVRRAFAAHPDAAAITFQCLDRDTHKPLKGYASRSHRHGLRSIASVWSVEIAVRRERVGALRFDTSFGLGARYPTGEEVIFLADMLRAGHALYYWPEPLCLHTGAASAERFWSEKIAEAKGAALARIYGNAWPAVAAYFAVAKYPEYRGSVGLPSFLWHSLKGGRKERS